MAASGPRRLAELARIAVWLAGFAAGNVRVDSQGIAHVITRVGTAIGLAETPPGGRAVRRRSSRSAAKAAAAEARSRDAEAQPRAAEAQTREMPPATPVRVEESSGRRVARL